MKAKKIIKIAGTAVTAAAMVFVVKKLFDMDISFSQLRDGKVIAALVLCFVIQTVVIIFSCYPWLVFTRSLSGRRIPFSAAMPVYTQSNLYKYLPGNVFQYVGRNQLAADMDGVQKNVTVFAADLRRQMAVHHLGERQHGGHAVVPELDRPLHVGRTGSGVEAHQV